MPTDESYLDSLLNGLNQDGNEPENNDRLSVYKKKKTENKDRRVEPEGQKPDKKKPAPKKPVKKKPEKKSTPVPVPNEEKRTATGLKTAAALKSGEIENYSIFDDYDDSAIDEIISNELSEERNDGELFAMSGDKYSDNSYDDEDYDKEIDALLDDAEQYLAGDEQEEETPVEEEPEPVIIPREEIIEAPLKEEKSEEDYLDSLFGDLMKTESESSAEETVKEDNDMDLGGFDFFNGVNDEPASDNQMDELLAGQVSDIEATEKETDRKKELADSEDIFALGNSDVKPAVFDEEEPENTEDSEYNNDLGFDFLNSDLSAHEEQAEDLFSTPSDSGADDQYEDPLQGFKFNEEDAAEEEEQKPAGIGSMLGDLGVDTFNEDDLAALDNLLNEIDIENPEEEEKPKKKKYVVKDKLPWYIRLFGNVKIPENKIKPEISEEELAKKKAEAKEAKKALKETKKEEKAEKKKAIADAKALKARQTAEEKELARKQKLEMASQMILEDVGNTTKLNKWGVLVIFALFIGIVAVTVSGGSTLAYNIGIRQASKLFDNALIYQDVSYYTRAYDKIYGLDIEEEDYELYDKILTINYVNTQLNAYNNHAKLDDYREGLNDLFKGLLRFRKWFAHATALGAQDDIYLVRSEILKNLWNIYGIDEAEAMFVLEHYDLLKSTYNDYDANLYYTRYIYEPVERLGLGSGD